MEKGKDTISRSEAENFRELERLSATPGYIHLFAELVFRNGFVRFTEKIQGSDFTKSFGRDRLIRTELSTYSG